MKGTEPRCSHCGGFATKDFIVRIVAKETSSHAQQTEVICLKCATMNGLLRIEDEA